MEKYSEFLQRIQIFEQPELVIGTGNFKPSDSVLKKVDKANRLSPYYGDTTVFHLDDEAKREVMALIDFLYREVPECFCERLVEDTLHMTLHDLSSSTDEAILAKDVMENQRRLIEVLKAHPEELAVTTISMRTNYIINMVNTSLVLALCPTDENEYAKLMALYNIIDEVRQLPYRLTPHITLAYYNRNGFDKEHVAKLADAVRVLNGIRFNITLSTKQLAYQRFTSMNSYSSVFLLV